MATFRRVTVVDPSVEDVAIENGAASGAMTALIVLAIVAVFMIIGYFAWYAPNQNAVQVPSSHTVIERDSTTNRTTTNVVPAQPPVVVHDAAPPVVIHDNPPAQPPIIIHDTPPATPTPTPTGDTSGSRGDN